MGLRLFTDETSWEQTRRDVRHARAALAATGDHANLANAMTKLLASWSSLDAERIEADDALVDANALVRYWDSQLDELVARLAARVIADHGKGSSEYLALFPEAPATIVRLGLESEIARVKKFDVVAKERKLSKGVQELLAQIGKVVTDGSKVLAARVTAAEGSARVALRVAAWKEDANAARRSVAISLDKWALENGAGRDYSHAFFPAAKTSKKKPAVATPSSPVNPPS
jgi:hypothetical protein